MNVGDVRGVRVCLWRLYSLLGVGGVLFAKADNGYTRGGGHYVSPSISVCVL